MGAAIKAELRKYFTTRMWWGMAIAMVLLAGGFSLLMGAVMGYASAGEDPQSTGTAMDPYDAAVGTYTGAVSFGYLLTLCIGILLIGQEYRHKTITSTFLSTPRRGRVMVAKVVTMLVLGAFYGLVFVASAVAGGAVGLLFNGAELFPQPMELARTLLLVLLVLGLWGLIGLGVGIMVPNQIAAILIAVGFAWLVEPIIMALGALVSWGSDVVQFMPSAATAAALDQSGLMSFSMGSAQTLSWWGGAVVLAAYAAIFTVIGMMLTRNKDIS